MARGKKSEEDVATSKDIWSPAVTEGPWSLSYIRRKFNPYTLTLHSDTPYEVELGFNDKKMTFYLESPAGPPTIELALKYVTDTVVKTVEILKKDKYFEPSIGKDTTTVWCYGFMWRHYCHVAEKFRGLVGDQIYKSLLE
jgi:hypothetical protein